MAGATEVLAAGGGPLSTPIAVGAPTTTAGEPVAVDVATGVLVL